MKRGALCLLAAFSLMADAINVYALSVGIAEKAEHLRAGEAATRTVQIGSPAKPQAIEVLWQAASSSVIIAQGSAHMALRGAGSSSMEIRFRVPSVDRKCALDLLVQATSATGESAYGAFEYWIYPPLPLGSSVSFLEGKRLGVFDPRRKTHEVLSGGPGRVELIPFIDSLTDFDGDLFVVGEGALDGRETRRKFDEMLEQSRLSVPTLILRQKSGASLKTRPASDSKLFKPEVAAEGHPVFTELELADLRGWRGGGLVGLASAHRPHCGNFRRLLIDSVSLGMSGSVFLQEWVTNMGSPILECQLPVVERFEAEPICSVLLVNLLRRLVEGVAPKWNSDFAVLGDPSNAALRELTKRLFAEDEDWEPAENPLAGAWNAGTLLVAGDRESLERILQVAPEFFQEESLRIEKGERLILVGARQDSLELLGQLIGMDGHAVEAASSEFQIPHPSSPLLWGLSQREWRDLFRSVDGQESAIPLGIVKDGNGAEALTLIEPGRFLRLAKGKGEILFLQAPLIPQRVEDLAATLGQILTNLSVRLPAAKEKTGS